jgi:hypothetical protein
LDEHEESEQLAKRLGVVGGVEVRPVEVASDQLLEIEGGEGDEDRDDCRQVKAVDLLPSSLSAHRPFANP